MPEPRRRFLAPKARKGDGLGYVNDPRLGMKDEPEVVGPAIVDAYTESALFWQSLRHAAEVQAARELRQDLTLEQRLRDAQRRAKQQHVNLSNEFHALSRMLDRAARGGRQSPDAAVSLMEQLEAKLDSP